MADTKTCGKCGERKPRAAFAQDRSRVDGDAKQARRRVNVLVRTGRLAHPNDSPCADCGHIWTAGERRHEYDHHRGYGAEHHLDVETVCTACHRVREQARAA